jgi:hypothetical protein
MPTTPWHPATFLLTIALIALATATATARAQAPEPTPEDIRAYKTKTAADCANDAIADGLAPDRANAFCSCLTDALWQNMPAPELRQAYETSLHGSQADEMALLLPYIRVATRQCGHLVGR